MGESMQEATIINWLKSVGDFVDFEEIILEVATDKVDSEVSSPVAGLIKEIFFQKDAVVAVGSVLAIIDESQKSKVESQISKVGSQEKEILHDDQLISTRDQQSIQRSNFEVKIPLTYNSKLTTRNPLPTTFLSPLIISIAQKENLSIEELQTINGSGTEGRIQKSDVYNYLKSRKYPIKSIPQPTTHNLQPTSFPAPKINFVAGKDIIVEMDRMRSIIANHMVYSKQTSPHVTSFIEVDVTELVVWRNENKDKFLAEYGEKLTFTPIFVQAVAKAILDFPMINVSVDGKKIVVHKDINIGMATALPNGNLIVPVVKNANEKSLHELAKAVNYLSESSRSNKLQPDDIQGSTFTISNVGTFGSLMGTPIINQPEVAILALGIIKKRPEVITTEKGDEIAIRSMMYLSLSFDHRVVDGFLGGSFLRKVGDYMESFKG
jgi:2-oxoglutarate dehydrogenase E2 component (dihydrolipoamide succinyltransferase)